MSDVLSSPVADLSVEGIGPEGVVYLELADGTRILADLTTPLYRGLLLDIVLRCYPMRWACGLSESSFLYLDV